MPERQPAPGETDETRTTSTESPADPDTSRPPGPSPRPVMPSPKPRGSAPTGAAGVDDTVAVGSVAPGGGTPGPDREATADLADETPTVTTPDASRPAGDATPAATDTPRPAGDVLPGSASGAGDPTAQGPAAPTTPRPSPSPQPGAAGVPFAGDSGRPAAADAAHDPTVSGAPGSSPARPDSTSEPVLQQPGVPSEAPSGAARAGASTPSPTGSPQPATTVSGPVQPGPGEPGSVQSGPSGSGAAQSGPVGPGAVQSDSGEPGGAQPGPSGPDGGQSAWSGAPAGETWTPGGADLFSPPPRATPDSVADTARLQPVPPSTRPTGGPAPTPGSPVPGQDPTVSDQPTRPSAAGAGAAGTAALPARGADPRSSAGEVPGSAESTQVLRPVGADPATQQMYAGPPDAGSPGGSGPDDPGEGDGAPGDGDGTPRRRGLLIAGAIVAVLVLAYLGDLFFSSGSVPRGVVVAGQEIGGMSRASAIEKLQGAIEPRSSQPVAVTAGEVRSEVDPKAAGLAVDYDGTLDEAGAQPLNPITRITSFFGTRDVPVVNKSDERSVRTAMEQLAPVVDRDPKDGTVRFDGLNPLPVAPEPGQRLDVDAAVGTLEQQWASGAPVALPLVIEQPTTTPEDVQQAIDQVARPAVSAPVTVTGEGANGTVKPEDIAQALTFKADPNASPKLVPQINVASLTDVVKPQLASTEKPAVDASLNLAVTPAAVVPSIDGRGIDYKATFGNLVPVLTGTGPRQVAAVYAPKPADLTTQEIQSLGNATEISSFTTRGFAADSGVNIRRAAEAIDGTIVAPGETFSLDDATNPRDASRGYVEAGIIEDGAPARGIGGGVSQLATTLYNASYFAGMVDVEHKEHSFYISRYPAGREATVFDNIIDLKFRNDGPTPVLIRTAWTPGDITVKFLGQKMYEVSSQTGPRTNPTSPQVVNIPPGRPCSPSKGAPGFTVTDTKTTRNIQTGETTSRTRTVRYNPSPIVQCG